MAFWDRFRTRIPKLDYVGIIEQYSRILEQRTEMIGRESDLPASKDQIRWALSKARQDPIYQLGGNAIDVAFESLDTFVPDDEYNTTSTFVRDTIDILQHKDAKRLDALLQQAPESHRRVLAQVFKIMGFARNQPK